MTALAAQDLTVAFGANLALDAVTFDVPSGITGLVGANGAGKTTLLSLALGLRAPSGGSITVLGKNPADHGPEVRSLIGYSPEKSILPDDMPAFDFVKHLAQLRGIPRNEARLRSSEVLWLVGLGEERFRALGTMSTGQRQRVKLAQAVASSPSLLLLDEPTDGLDPVQRDEMLALIAKVATEFSIDVILSSHLLEEVERICDHVVALDAGSLVACGGLDELVGTIEGIEMELFDRSEGHRERDAVVSTLRASGVQVDVDGVVLTLSGAERSVLADQARDSVAQHGARLRRISDRRRRLDDLFQGGPR